MDSRTSHMSPLKLLSCHFNSCNIALLKILPQILDSKGFSVFLASPLRFSDIFKITSQSASNLENEDRLCGTGAVMQEKDWAIFLKIIDFLVKITIFRGSHHCLPKLNYLIPWLKLGQRIIKSNLKFTFIISQPSSVVGFQLDILIAAY